MGLVEERNAARQQSIALARRVRSQRGEIRRALKAKELDPHRLIEGRSDPAIEAVVSRMKVKDFLPMIPGIGKPMAHEVLLAFECRSETRFDQLSHERRVQLSYIVAGARDPRFN